MMVKSLVLHTFRNINKAQLNLDPGLNIIFGDNGSGKTALLEALYFLNTGRSFRTSQTEHLIQQEQQDFTLIAELEHETQSTLRLALKKTRRQDTEMRINQDKIKKWSDFAKWLPIQALTPESFSLLLDGPKTRRSFIDWGIFYQDDSYHTDWALFQKVHQQRNALLKSTGLNAQIETWNQHYILYAEKVTGRRISYINSLNDVLQGIIDTFLPQFNLQISYEHGWDSKYALLQVLNNQLERDKIAGYTHSGPHKADLIIKANHVPAKQILSRGQLKLLVCALKLAQGKLLQLTTGKKALYMIDDLSSELDQQHRTVLMQQLQAIGAQQLVTTIEPKAITNVLSQIPAKVFHVKHGQVSEHK